MAAMHDQASDPTTSYPEQSIGSNLVPDSVSDLQLEHQSENHQWYDSEYTVYSSNRHEESCQPPQELRRSTIKDKTSSREIWKSHLISRYSTFTGRRIMSVWTHSSFGM